ncbi:hypothetical protein F511_14511 [Dorcoceras hygrometricum]|uniref:Uncharacterized protein n=1 Tax=Dorcoceras hygrometricum TaxID=472368 RepID=A0A2Z7AY94_9LAMI|nr:hypothetical protein F511_14511 [Dorcoceras hygrometricum]
MELDQQLCDLVRITSSSCMLNHSNIKSHTSGSAPVRAGSSMSSQGVSRGVTLLATGAWLQPESQGDWLFTEVALPKSSSYAQHIELSIRAGISNPVLVTLNGSGIQLAVGPQPLRLRNHNSGLAHRIMYGPFNPYIPIRSTTIGKSRVAIDPIAMHTSWRSNSDITSVTSIGYPRMSASGESSTTMHRLLHASGPHPIPPPNYPKTNQYNQDLGLIHSTNGNHLESPNEGSSIDHQVTIYLHAQNITMFPTNETWYFASQILFSSSGGLILILTAQSTRN